MKQYVLIKRKYLLFPAMVLDLLGGLVFRVIRALSPSERPDNPATILLVRLDHMGDVLMATAGLTPLRETFPRARIDFLAASWAADVVKHDPRVDHVVQFDPAWFDRVRPTGWMAQARDIRSLARTIRRGQYDVAIDFKSDLRNILALFIAGVPCRIGYGGINGGEFLLTHRERYQQGLHETELNLRLLRALGVKMKEIKPKMVLGPDADARAKELIACHDIPQRFAVYHTAPGTPDKRWDVAAFARLIDHMAIQHGLPGVLIGAKGDHDLARDIATRVKSRLVDITGKTDLQVLAGIIQLSSLFVGVDSGPAHLAAAFSRPGVVIFTGGNDPAQWKPAGSSVRVVCPGVSGFEKVCNAVEGVLRATA